MKINKTKEYYFNKIAREHLEENFPSDFLKMDIAYKYLSKSELEHLEEIVEVEE